MKELIMKESRKLNGIEITEGIIYLDNLMASIVYGDSMINPTYNLDVTTDISSLISYQKKLLNIHLNTNQTVSYRNILEDIIIIIQLTEPSVSIRQILESIVLGMEEKTEFIQTTDLIYFIKRILADIGTINEKNEFLVKLVSKIAKEI